MGKRNRNSRNRLLVWIVSLAMLLTGVAMPTGTKKAQAEDGTLDLLNGKSITKTGTVEKDPYGDDLFCEEAFDGLSSELLNNGASGYSSLKFEATVKVNSCSEGTPTIVLYSMDKDYGGWKDAGKAAEIGTDQTVSLDIMSFSSFSRVGIRFTQCAAGTTINYTISSAKIIGTKSGGSSGGGGETATEEQLKGVSITLNPLQVSNDWSEYNFSIENTTSEALTNFIIMIPVLGNVNNLQSFGGIGSATYSDSDRAIFVYFTKTVPANGTYTCPNDAKFGFGGGGATLGTPVAIEDDGSYTPANKLNYEITGKPKENVAFEDTPFGKHGKLQLKKVDGYPAPVIVDAQGQPYQLRGASTHGMQWYPEYVNEDAFRVLRDEWGVNMVRLVSYVTQYNGYTTGGQDILDSKIVEGVEAAKKLGLYVIIDWHIHEENPNTTKMAAREFFEKYAAKYKDYDNVIFEICNEPTGTPWYNGSNNDIYNYADEMCGIIRNAGSDAIIVCGTNTWSQDVHEVKGHTIEYDNVMYTFHFYSGTHGEDLRNRVKSVSEDGIPIFVTEFGVCAASGNGGYDTANADKWIELCDKYNISFACWSFCNKAESASYLLSSCTKTTGGWQAEDLTETGFWLINTYRAHQDKENNTSTGIPEPSSSAKPSATPGPNSSTAPANTPSPGSSAAPSATPSPSSSVAPANTPGPGSSVEPSATPSPGSSAAPAKTPEPSSSAKPESSNGPGGNIPFHSQAPSQTNPPGGTADPYASRNPQPSVAPGADKVAVITDPNHAISNQWFGADPALAEQTIMSQKSDEDIAGSTFSVLKLRAAKTAKNSVKLKWGAAAGASKYIIYGNCCGKNNTLRKLATVTGTGWTHTGLKKDTYYKYLITACQTINGADATIGISKTVHAATLGGKKGNAQKITVKKAKVIFKQGKSFTIKAKQVPLKKKSKIAKHRKISYESSDPAIATVSSSGKMKAKKKGKCNIYVYAQNGVYKQIRVTVK